MTTFASSRDRVKAKLIGVGKSGGKVTWVAPRSKPVIEFHWWVLWHKLRVAAGVVTLLLLGAAFSYFGFYPFLVLATVIFVITAIIAKPCP